MQSIIEFIKDWDTMESVKHEYFYFRESFRPQLN